MLFRGQNEPLLEISINDLCEVVSMMRSTAIRLPDDLRRKSRFYNLNFNEIARQAIANAIEVVEEIPHHDSPPFCKTLDESEGEE